MATALVVGNMVGSGVFGLPSALAGTGPIALLAWVFTGAGAILLALVFANLGRCIPAPRRAIRLHAHPPSATSPDSGLRGATGSPPGPATPRSRSSSSATPSVFWPSLAHKQRPCLRAGVVGDLGLTLLNMAGVRESGMMQVVTTVLKFVPLLLIGVIGLFNIQHRQLLSLRPEPRQPGGPLPRHLVRRHVDTVGVPGAGVGHRAGRGDQGTSSAPCRRATIFGTPCRDGAVCDLDGRSHGRDPQRKAGRLPRSVCRRRSGHCSGTSVLGDVTQPS